MVPSAGILSYSMGSEGPRLVLEVDPELARLARKLIPPVYNAKQMRYAPHVTVVRREAIDESAGLRYNGELVEFMYDPVIALDDTYFWYRVYSLRLNFVRLELGLPSETALTRPPDGQSCFHLTVANRKP